MTQPKRLWHSISDLVFPIICFRCQAEGHWWCRPTTQKTLWPRCLLGQHNYHAKPMSGCQQRGVPVIAFGSYDDPGLRQAIHAWKYDGSWQISQNWAADLAATMTAWAEKPSGLVPIPLHWQRHLARGYNQAMVLAHQIARTSQQPIYPVLSRRQFRRPQVGLNRSDRLINTSAIFQAELHRNQPPVWLLDDVLTTGATLKTARQALVASGWTVRGAVVLALTGA